MIGFVIQHHAHRPLANLRCELVRYLAHSRPFLSGVGASAIPGRFRALMRALPSSSLALIQRGFRQHHRSKAVDLCTLKRWQREHASSEAKILGYHVFIRQNGGEKRAIAPHNPGNFWTSERETGRLGCPPRVADDNDSLVWLQEKITSSGPDWRTTSTQMWFDEYPPTA